MLATALAALFVLTMAIALIVLVQSARAAIAVYGPIRDALAATPDFRDARVGRADILVNVTAPVRHAAVTRLPGRVRRLANMRLPLAA